MKPMNNHIIRTIKNTFFIFASNKGLLAILPLILMQLVLTIMVSHEINRSFVIRSYEREISSSSLGDSCVKGQIELAKIRGKKLDISRCTPVLEAQTTTYLSQEKSNLSNSRRHFKKSLLSYLYLNKDELKKMEIANREFSYIALKNTFEANKKAGMFTDKKMEKSALRSIEFYEDYLLTSDEVIDDIYDEWVKMLTPSLLYVWILAFIIASLIRRKVVW